MRRTDCQQLAEFRSAYVDGALADADRELVLNHLVSCADCRAEVEDLRAVRQLLNRVRFQSDGVPETTDLSFRLVSIAGQEAHQPVWCRPFRRTRSGGLPKVRRAVRLRTTAAALAFGGVLSTLGVIGYAAAPPSRQDPVSDPTGRVRSEFAATLNQFPLASRTVNALMMAPPSGLLPRKSRVAPRAEAATSRLPVTSEIALTQLSRAANDSDQVSYIGTQQVTAAVDDGTVTATARIAFEAGQGSAVSVYNASGQQLVEGFVPESTSTRIGNAQLLTLLRRNYQITGYVGGTVLGRPVTVVEAATPQPDGHVVVSHSTAHDNAVGGAGGPSTVAARWWIDNATGLLLRQETYDASGAVTSSAGFTSLTVTAGPVFMEHLAPRLATTTTTASLTLSSVAQLSTLGWVCPDRVAGLSLVRLRSDVAADPAALHLVYSDGVSSLSVFEQRGALTGPPSGSRWDASLQAYVTSGTPMMATWQSGDRVFTVATDSSHGLVDQAVRALPHVKPLTPTTMERVHAGWVRILERVR